MAPTTDPPDTSRDACARRGWSLGAASLALLPAFALAALALAGCDSAEDGEASTSEGATGAGGAASTGSAGGEEPAATVQVVEGAPREAEVPGSATTEVDADLMATGIVDGAAAFGTVDGLRVVDAATGDLLTVDLFDVEADELASPGAIRAVARRAAGGAFVAADAGLLHDFGTVLLLSPLDAAVDVGTVVSLDARGRDDDADREELWIAGETGAVHVLDEVVSVEVEGLPIERVVAVADGVAIATSGGSLVEIDLGAGSARVLTADLGAVHDAARAEDGTAWFAADAGLVRRAPDGTLTRFTLAPAGAAPLVVRSVAAAFGAVAAVGDAGLVGVDADGPFVIDGGASPDARAALDGAGDVWTAAGSSAVRYQTGAPVTFAIDVAPLLADQCSTCHADGLDDAPVLDFADYDAVVELAPSIADRITKAASPMPPTGLLQAGETAPVLRWIATGLTP